MAPARIAAATALLTLACACACAPASSWGAVSTGGVQSPAAVPAPSPRATSAAPSPRATSAALEGGSEYGVATAPPRPVVGLLRVPAAAAPGRPPRVSVRIDDAAAGRVNARVTVTDLATHRPVLVVRLGWIPAGRVVDVAWPHGATLAPGSYHVSVVARDGHGASLLRRAHSSGVSTLKVDAAPSPAPSLPPELPEVGTATPATLAAAGAVFPVAGPHSYGGPENRFGAARAGHVHEGQDVLTSEGTPVIAPLRGVVATSAFQSGGAGYYVVEHTEVGLDFMFAHCEAHSVAVSEGEALAPGQLLCAAGATGDATGPHLHFEVWAGTWQQGGHPIDPLPYLQAWDHSGAR